MGPVVVVGAGVAGVRTVRQLRCRGHLGAIILLEAQGGLPYDRPPLSKEVLRGEQDFPVTIDVDEFGALDVDWRPESPVVRLDPGSRVVVGADGVRLGYETLVVATGARARRVSGLGGQVVRTYGDVLALRSYGHPGRMVVVVGAGVLGCELAASFRELGAEVHLVDLAPAPMLRVVGPVVAAEIAALHEGQGVVWHPGVAARRVDPDRVTLSDGCVLRPDLVVEAVGVEPDVAWLAGSGLDLSDGVRCDDRQRTPLPGVYVVGDVAAPEGRRSEHWTAAVEQADRAVAAILGLEGRPPEPSYWWSDQYGEKLQGIGEISAADEVVVGGARNGRLVVFGRGGRVVGAIGLAAPGPLMRMRGAVVAGEAMSVAVSTLVDPRSPTIA